MISAVFCCGNVHGFRHWFQWSCAGAGISVHHKNTILKVLLATVLERCSSSVILHVFLGGTFLISETYAIAILSFRSFVSCTSIWTLGDDSCLNQAVGAAGMWGPGIVGLAMGALLLFAVKDSPEKIGYPPVEIVKAKPKKVAGPPNIASFPIPACAAR